MRGHRKLSGRTLAGVGITAGVAVLAALGGNLPAAAQEGVIIGANAEDAIDNSYIVVLKDGTSVTDVADRHGADVEHVYEHALNGFSATMSEAMAKRAAADPRVAYVEQNRVFHTTAEQTNPPSWGLDRVDQATCRSTTPTATTPQAPACTAYVIDTGIRHHARDFGGRAAHGYDPSTTTATPTTATGTARTSRAPSAAAPTVWPRASNSSPSACSTAGLRYQRRRGRRHRLGDRERHGRPWQT